MNAQNWRKISCSSSQLQLKATLTGGQSFRWKIYNDADTDDEEYLGVMANCLWLLKQTQSHLQYKIIGELPYGKIKQDEPADKYGAIRVKIQRPEVLSKNNTGLLYSDEYYKQLLETYFRLNVHLEKQYQLWSKCHTHFKENADKFYAIRVLNQDPVENLFSFICSQNNHINRISSMVEKLCTTYGTKICDFNNHSYYTFPDIETLSQPEIEGELRKAGFGYRAKFIQKSAAQIKENGGLEWFYKLEKLDYKEAHAELVSLTGIGPKVADCICLMSLNHLQAIPVDTHVFKIASQHYLPHLSTAKCVTSKIYNEIGDKFRDIYGPLAGWAQTVLFCADLRQFKNNEAEKVAKKRKK